MTFLWRIWANNTAKTETRKAPIPSSRSRTIDLWKTADSWRNKIPIVHRSTNRAIEGHLLVKPSIRLIRFHFICRRVTKQGIVRMAERSKAPDSRLNSLVQLELLAFWSSTEGVGSNPTSDTIKSLNNFPYLHRAFRHWLSNEAEIAQLGER